MAFRYKEAVKMMSQSRKLVSKLSDWKPQAVLQVRLAHTDIEPPDFDKYRRKSLRSPCARTRDSEADRKTFTYLLSVATLASALYATKAECLRYIKFMAASAEVLALAKIEIKLDEIPEGKHATFKWRGKPLFVKHRTPADIERERAVPVASLRDPETDEQRCKDPNWLVVIGVCTHLGCVPINGLGDFGGYYCPCHGSHFDGAGRARKGPAPKNLEVPHYEFVDSHTLVVG